MRASLLLQCMLLFLLPAWGKQVIKIHVEAVVVVNGQFLVNLEAAGERLIDQVLGVTVLGGGGKGGKGGKVRKAGKGGASCPVLDLSLAPIHLDLLGLDVDTSQICLDVTAQAGQGLLGDLVCDLAHALDGGGLAGFLAGLSPLQLSTLLGGLETLLENALDHVTTVGGAGNAVATLLSRRQSCPILRLNLAPVHLNLLGLQVDLDNCANGPVKLDITAVTGDGALLGNLLCEVANLHLSVNEIVALVADLIKSLTNGPLLAQLTTLLHAILDDGSVTVIELQQIVTLLGAVPGSLLNVTTVSGAVAGSLGLGAAALYGLRRKRRVKASQPNVQEPVPIKVETLEV